MRSYERVEITEKELEDAVRQAPTLIEEGLRFVDHQRKTERGPLDVLLVDGDGALVLAELKVQESDEMLMQGLDYYDYIATHIEGIAAVYKDHSIDVSKGPRLMLIAPSFSQRLVSRCRWISEEVSISLHSFQPIKLDDGSTTVVYTPVEMARKPETETPIPTRAELLDYIRDDEARRLADKFLEEMQALGGDAITVDYKPWGASIKLKGRVVAYWEVRREYFRVSAYDAEGNWKGVNIQDRTTLAEVLERLRLT